MSEQTTTATTATTSSPLREAQALVTELQQKADISQEDLKANLGKLADLLKRAESSGEGEDAEALRKRLDELVSNTASFNSMMVHEIRKPMTSIRGYSDMLAKPGMIGSLNE